MTPHSTFSATPYPSSPLPHFKTQFSSRLSRRNPSVLLSEEVHFEGKKPKNLIAGLIIGAGLGFTSFLSGVGTFLYAHSSAYAKEEPTALETQFDTENIAHNQKQLKGAAFDSISTTLKKGLYRAVTGDKASEAYIDKMNYKLLRNSQIETEEYLYSLVYEIAKASQKQEAITATSRSIVDSKSSRDEFYDTIQDVIAAQHKKPSSNPVVKFIMGDSKAKLEEAIQKLDNNDRIVLLEMAHDFLQSQRLPSIEAHQALYNRFVTEIVKKYHPEQVALCQQAGDAVFTQIRENKDKIQAEKKAKALTVEYAAYMSGLGLVAMVILTGLGIKLDNKNYPEDNAEKRMQGLRQGLNDDLRKKLERPKAIEYIEPPPKPTKD